jgi:hypothetical protein
MEEKRTVRVQVVMTPSEAESLDDWGFSQRIRSRSEMLRRLMKVALEALAKEQSPRAEHAKTGSVAHPRSNPTR